MRLGMIWAEARDADGRGVIGRGGDMPWHLPEDLAYFKRVTLGAPVIMGRRTWESLPERFRPLPGRRNLVVTRDPVYDAPGAGVVASLEDAVAELSGGGSGAAGAVVDGEAGDPSPEIAWVTGGGQLYRAAMPLADELSVTRIDLEVDGADTFAPEIGPEWELAEAGEPLVSKTGLGYRFERWVRR
ncbi:dihydrofolate reductase [Leucobacter ruminantium]